MTPPDPKAVAEAVERWTRYEYCDRDTEGHSIDEYDDLRTLAAAYIDSLPTPARFDPCDSHSAEGGK